MRFLSGDTTQFIYFVAVDATDLTTRETGLSSFTVYRSRNGGAAAAFTTPTVNETDATNMPGVYELLLDEDMTIDAGDDSQAVALHITHAGMAPVTLTFELYLAKATAGETLTVASGVGSANATQLNGDSTALGNLRTSFNDTAGAVPWQGIIDQGTMQAGSTGTTAVLRAGASFADDVMNGATIFITGGTGIGQRRLVTDWVSATDTATVDAWNTTPDNTSTYKVLATAPSSGASTPPTAAAIADAVWDEAQADHVAAGSFGEVATEVAAILVDTGTTLDGRIPAALVGGRMDASVGAMAANVITAAATAADFGTEVGTAVWATAARTVTAATNITSTGAAVPIDANGLVSINTVRINGVVVAGAGTSGDLWRA